MEKSQHIIHLFSCKQESLSEVNIIFILEQGREPWPLKSEVKIEKKKIRWVGMYQ